MDYIETPFGSPDYKAACILRDVVMRMPIGLRLGEADIIGEDTQFHFIARDEHGLVVGTVLFKPLSETHAKLRQMAIDTKCHGKGIGKALVEHAEAAIKAKGFATIETNARITAQGFYETLGYATGGAIFEEVGLPTIRMTKEL